MEKTIVMFKGKYFEEMSREELLEFVMWASPLVEFAQKEEKLTRDGRIEAEIDRKYPRRKDTNIEVLAAIILGLFYLSVFIIIGASGFFSL